MESMVVSADFWQGKKVFLTGHTGFKGSWLSLFLQHLQANVLGYALEPYTAPNLFSIAHTAENMQSIIADIRDYSHLTHTLQEYKPDIVIHMAAQALVRTSYEHPVDTYSTNVMGTVHVLEAARFCPSVKAVIVVTSDKCYENREWVWPYRENDVLGGRDPYSNSKGCAELVTQSYRDSFFNGENSTVGVASVRAGNVIGGGDWSTDRLLPDLMRAMISKQPLHLRYPHALRPWQHVLDSLSGYLLLAENLFYFPQKFNEGWNFGPNSNSIHSVKSVVEKTMNYWEEKIPVKIEESALHEARFLALDSTKAKVRLGWQPVWDLERALQETSQWYQAYFGKETDMRAFTLEQIQNYINKK